jgi:hypothetical protein
MWRAADWPALPFRLAPPGPARTCPEESLTDSLIVAYGGGGTNPPPATTLTVPGGMADDTVVMPDGIASVASERGIEECYFLDGDPDRPLTATERGRHGGSLSATSLVNSVIEATALASIKVTGPQGITGSTIEADARGVTGDAIGAITVAGGVDPTTAVTSLGGIASITVGGTYRDIVSDPEWNWGVAPDPTAGTLGSLTAGEMDGAVVEADFIGSIKVTGNAAAGLAGNLTDAAISAIGSSPTAAAIGTISVAGDCVDDSILAWGQVAGTRVGGAMSARKQTTQQFYQWDLACGLDPNPKDKTGLGTFAVGALYDVAVVTQFVQAVTVGGNPATGLAGIANDLQLDVLGSSKGTGLGTFTAANGVQSSTIDVAAGNVGAVSVGAFLDSYLLVGAMLPNATDPHGSPPIFSGTFSIGSFRTTAPFDPTDPADSAAFQDSTVLAATLGTVVLSSVDPVPVARSGVVSFGLFFKPGTGGGSVTVNGSKTLLKPSDTPQPIENSPPGDAFYYES